MVVTHEHWHHVSGFLTEAEQFAKFAVGEVWMAWTENPKDLQAQKLDKFKQQALATLELASSRLSLAETLRPLRQPALFRAEGFAAHAAWCHQLARLRPWPSTR